MPAFAKNDLLERVAYGPVFQYDFLINYKLQ
jgi:hypothetical protein